MSETVAPTPLKLLAFDAEDLEVFSAHAQDMSVKASDIAWFAADKTFALAGERFDWLGADRGHCERVFCGLHFDRVLRVRKQAMDGRETLNLLSILFEETDAPAGAVTLAFSGGATSSARCGVPGGAYARFRPATPLRLQARPSGAGYARKPSRSPVARGFHTAPKPAKPLALHPEQMSRRPRRGDGNAATARCESP